ncbi:MAG: TVP38/TMEM64 family inner membrane protein YdjZ [Promethearchaeota archaeon]|nr:MAG: TVP38/TMEM64 family inner membrane protein YdjZ [Candidatus Lokiarchaeota archaeon]
MEQNNEKTDDQQNPTSERIKEYFKNLVDFSSYDAKTIFFIIVMIILVGISLYLIYLLVFVDSTILYRLVVDWFVNPIYSLGFWGIFLFIGVMAVQGLLIPIPSEIVLLSTGMIWGWVLGGVFGIIGSVAAGVLCYYISRKGGRPLAEKLVGESAIAMADNFIDKYGVAAILIARFLPFIAFDPISYTAGIVDLNAKKYTLATFLGSIPRAFFYAFLGASLGITPPINFEQIPIAEIEAQSNSFNIILLIVAIVLLVIFALYYVTSRYYKKRAEKLKNQQPQPTT